MFTLLSVNRSRWLKTTNISRIYPWRLSGPQLNHHWGNSDATAIADFKPEQMSWDHAETILMWSQNMCLGEEWRILFSDSSSSSRVVFCVRWLSYSQPKIKHFESPLAASQSFSLCDINLCQASIKSWFICKQQVAVGFYHIKFMVSCKVIVHSYE